MKKWVLGVLLLGCAVFAFAQDAVVLDTAIGNSASYMAERLPKGVQVVVLNFNAPTVEMSNYAIDELAAGIANDGRLTVVDRRNLELLQQEMDFQLSGEVSDETAQAIGRKLGAQFILSGSITPLGNVHRIRLQAIHVETARIQTVFTANVKQDSVLAALLKGTPVAAASSAQPGASSASGAHSSSYSGDDAWKNKWLYLGARIGGAARFYNFSDSALNGMTTFNGTLYHINSKVNPDYTSGNFEIAFQVTAQIIPLLALQTEFIVARDKAVTDYNVTVVNQINIIQGTYSPKNTFDSTTLSIPLLAKLTFKPGNFLIAPLAASHLMCLWGKWIRQWNQAALLKAILLIIPSPLVMWPGLILVINLGRACFFSISGQPGISNI
ncbi:CsgG/HfaB family protein [Leadbettera azotonutricia]|uniref:Curli production assembly/transport component CsgG n=1 Tax=Leadbettera azotonutricia (strain ATCC BAA-888 / DSM 13862 / ZAS-9) TaxID=545695 RepID=F5YBX8_LEAAZ|nr:CsgG/HfaB family protein [Leadbettera azotonutricia]AEF80948.1 hypothetical protein TREAZ_1828 [Leadbettera azotonutricia ZAS-9]